MSITENRVKSFSELTREPRILLGPGPSLVHPRVLQAMSSPLVGHLDPYFLEIMDRIQEMLRYIFETNNRLTVPISGTGSAAMETAVANMVEQGDKVLVFISGYFGHRLADMAKRYGGKVQVVECPWGEAFSSETVEKAMKEYQPRVVGIVHAETSTGVLQPLEEIAAIVHKYNAILIVDAVTSLGGVSVGVDRLGLDVCYSGTQKCLASPPGLGPITFGERAEEKLRNRKLPVTSWYLDMSLMQKYWGNDRTYHHTAPISANFALYESLRMIVEEGLENRWVRHLKNAEFLWNGLEEIGLKPLVDRKYRLPSLTTVSVPEGVDEKHVRDQLLLDYNIEIAGGLGVLSGKVWRIGLMGYSSSKPNVTLLLAALNKIVNR